MVLLIPTPHIHRQCPNFCGPCSGLAKLLSEKMIELQVWCEDTCPACTDTFMLKGETHPASSPGHRVPCGTQSPVAVHPSRAPWHLHARTLLAMMCSRWLKAHGRSLQCWSAKSRMLSRQLTLKKVFIFCLNWCTRFIFLILSDTAQAFSGFAGECLSFDTRSQKN